MQTIDMLTEILKYFVDMQLSWSPGKSVAWELILHGTFFVIIFYKLHAMFRFQVHGI